MNDEFAESTGETDNSRKDICIKVQDSSSFRHGSYYICRFTHAYVISEAIIEKFLQCYVTPTLSVNGIFVAGEQGSSRIPRTHRFSETILENVHCACVLAFRKFSSRNGQSFCERFANSRILELATFPKYVRE